MENPIPCKTYKEDDQCFIHKTGKYEQFPFIL